MRAMLATPGATVPTGPGWAHEIKWDGMRILADVSDGQVRLTARSGADATDRFPELAALGSAYPDVLLDGEVVAFADDGLPSFGLLSERIHVRDRRSAQRMADRRPVSYLIFDVLRLDGVDVTGLPWRDRRSLLERMDLTGRAWQTPPTYDDGPALLDATAAQGLEGVVSKRLTSRYSPGRRSRDWIKVPHRRLRSVVIGGWRPETESTSRLGAVLVGEPGPNGLHYLGRVGSGLAGRAGDEVLAALRDSTAAESPFDAELPSLDRAGATWVRPEIVVDVRSLGIGTAGRLRQPSYQRLRPDLAPADVAGSPGPALDTASDTPTDTAIATPTDTALTTALDTDDERSRS